MTCLELQCPLTSLTQCIIIALVCRDQIALSHYMRTNQRAHLLSEPNMAQIRLSQSLVALSSNILAVRSDHFVHLLGRGDKPSDIVQKCSQDDLGVISMFGGLCGKICTL